MKSRTNINCPRGKASGSVKCPPGVWEYPGMKGWGLEIDKWFLNESVLPPLSLLSSKNPHPKTLYNLPPILKSESKCLDLQAY